MDNFIEDSISYLFYNGGFDLITGDQRFEFRIRPNGEIEVTSITNHIKKIYKGLPDTYQFFAFLIFCDMYSSKQKTTIVLCKDRNVSNNNINALNIIYSILKTMLSIDGKELYESITSDDPSEIDHIMLQRAFDEEIMNEHLKFELLKERIESLAFYFARRFEYWNNLYDEFLTTEDYEQLHEYAFVRLEELKNNIDAKHPHFFSREETLQILFLRINHLSIDLELDIEGGESQKHLILENLMLLFDLEIDIFDIILLIKDAFEVAIINEEDVVSTSAFIEAIELSYLPDDIIQKLTNKLRSKKKKDNSKMDNILIFKDLK